MLEYIFRSRIIDIVLIILALRYVFPSLFAFKVIKLNDRNPGYRQNDEGSIHIKTPQKDKAKDNDNLGEYIDYEEVK